MIKQLFSFMLIIAVTFVLFNCTRNFEALGPESPIRALTASESQIIKSSSNFGFELLKQVQNTQKDENIFISPLSVSMALGMTYNGAANETATAMKNTLGFSNLSHAEINNSYKSLLELLSGFDPNVRLDIANSIWYRMGFTVEQTFIDTNKQYFDANISALDFNVPSSVDVINNWVDTTTNGKIDQIIDSIDPMTMMFLINAIYFNGTWTYEFDKTFTSDGTFHISSDKSIDIPLMTQDNNFAHFHNNELQMIDLPYGDGSYCMTVLLPSRESSADALVESLDRATWTALLRKLKKTEGSLYLPKFKLAYEKVLNDVLATMGMDVAFNSNKADFTNINKDGELYISKVKHKSFVDVYEEGTEASAVTVVTVQALGISEGPAKFTMYVDRPFVFVIREKNTGTILFMGKIMDPSKSE
jgi:serine protease inhibitor